MAEQKEALSVDTLVDGARMYAAAAYAVNLQYPNALHVLSHLLGMSIELALKAYLRHAGFTVGQLRKLCHDLARLLAAAEERGLIKTGSRHFRLSVLGANYRERLFAYPEAGVLNVILPWSLRKIADGLITEAFIAVKGQKLCEQMSGEPGLAIASEYPEDVAPGAWAVRTPDSPAEHEAG
jgi:hypothetical protein